MLERESKKQCEGYKSEHDGAWTSTRVFMQMLREVYAMHKVRKGNKEGFLRFLTRILGQTRSTNNGVFIALISRVLTRRDISAYITSG